MNYKNILLGLVVVGFTALNAGGTKFNLNASAPDDMTTYYKSAAQPLEVVKEKLAKNGFEILAATTPAKGQTVLSVTNKELKDTNSWMSVININVGSDGVRVQNPSYFGAAYLKGYKFGKFKKTLESLQNVMGDMYTTKQEYEFDELEDYRFAFAMPYVDDTIKVGKGNYLASKTQNNENIAYTLKLPNGSILVGHNLSSEVNGFLGKLTQGKNAQILPYKSLIKDGKAEILNPKYYLAVSLPLLSMGGFMKISDIPGKIEDEIEASYK